MSLLNHVLNIETLTFGTHDFHLIATPVEKTEIAKRLDIVSIENLEVNLELIINRRLLFTGTIQAVLTQQCSRTLVPFPQTITITINEIILREPRDEKGDEELGEEEVLEGPLLDLGEIIIQLLSLNLDPYPIAPGSKPIEYHDENGNSSPFKVLKKEE